MKRALCSLIHTYSRTHVLTTSFWFTLIWFYFYLLSLFNSDVSVSVATDNDIFIQTHAALVSEISCWCCSLNLGRREAWGCKFSKAGWQVHLQELTHTHTVTAATTIKYSDTHTNTRHEAQTWETNKRCGRWHLALCFHTLFLCKFLILFILLFLHAATLMASVAAAHFSRLYFDIISI